MTNEQLSALLTSLHANSDTDAFEKIYNELSTPVFAIILRITQNRQLAEDILQEVFIKLYRSAASSALSAKNPRAYIFQIAHKHLHSQSGAREHDGLDAVLEQ